LFALSEKENRKIIHAGTASPDRRRNANQRSEVRGRHEP
jgi:hypothetical protein